MRLLTAAGDEARRDGVAPRRGDPSGGSQDVAGRVGQQQAGEPRPEPLLLRQRQRRARTARADPVRRR